MLGGVTRHIAGHTTLLALRRVLGSLRHEDGGTRELTIAQVPQGRVRIRKRVGYDLRLDRSAGGDGKKLQRVAPRKIGTERTVRSPHSSRYGIAGMSLM